MIIFSSTPGDGVKASIIGEIYSWDAQDVVYMLSQADGNGLELWISSRGGDVDAAFAMRNALEAYPGDIVIHTAGVVASAALLLLCIPKAKVIAHNGSIFMMHLAASVFYANADEARKNAEVLDIFDAQIAKILSTRINLSEDAIHALMREENWFDSDKALEYGLVNELAGGEDKGLSAPLFNLNSDDADASESENGDDEMRNAITNISDRFSVVQDKLNAVLNKQDSDRAVSSASQSAVQAIASASQSACDNVKKETSACLDLLRNEFEKVREEIEANKQAYNEQRKEYLALNENLSRIYALEGGEMRYTVHQTRGTMEPEFKLNKP